MGKGDMTNRLNSPKQTLDEMAALVQSQWDAIDRRPIKVIVTTEDQLEAIRQACAESEPTIDIGVYTQGFEQAMDITAIRLEAYSSASEAMVRAKDLATEGKGVMLIVDRDDHEMN